MNYDEYQEQPQDEALQRLNGLVRDMSQAELDVLEKQQELKKAQERLAELKFKEIPDAMEALGLEECTTTDGLKISIKEEIHAGIPASPKTPETRERRVKALKYLRENAESLIKHKFDIQLGKGSEEKSDLIKEFLQERGIKFKETPFVHPQTLKAWVREKLESGEDIPIELLNVHRQRVARVK